MIRLLLVIATMVAFVAAPYSVLCQSSPQAASQTTAKSSTSESSSKPSVFIQAENGFQSALAAGFIKKQVPANVVTEESRATYTLKSADVFAKPESTGSKVARCLFAYCAGIEGTASVSVQLVRNSDHAIVWAYQVKKGNSGPSGIQSLSEAIAKHVRNDYFDKQK
jgi:hypothetical protein